MSGLYPLPYIQELTMKLQRVLEEDLSRGHLRRANPDALGDPFELERTRRSAAPSPEAILDDYQEQLKGKHHQNDLHASTVICSKFVLADFDTEAGYRSQNAE
jgi:hypothetical protein